ncbi:DUF4245 family protein [Aquipuribacter sp. MA13-6]|uniref:DUF4245 family protein n=1 Tax=unclassified Aquipuribacter TaxID=2635084 RepID=UPI003EF032D6
MATERRAVRSDHDVDQCLTDHQSPHHEGRLVIGHHGGVSVSEPAAGPGPAPARRRGRQTAFDMVVSMAVILGVVGAVLLFAPQPGAVEQPQVGGTQAVTAVDEAASALGAPPLLLVAGPAAQELGAADVPEAADVVDVGEGWRLDYARTETTDDVATWRLGVLSPDERRVDLEQAVAPTDEWLTRADAGSVGPPEPVDLGGLSWSRQVRGDGDTAYTHVAETADGSSAPGLTTVVSGTSDHDALRAVVELVATSLGD